MCIVSYGERVKIVFSRNRHRTSIGEIVSEITNTITIYYWLKAPFNNPYKTGNSESNL